MEIMLEVDENKNQNTELKSQLNKKISSNWNLILKSDFNSIKKKDKKNLKKKVFSISNSNWNNKYNEEELNKRRNEWLNNFELNRIFFEEFPVYRKEYQYPEIYNTNNLNNCDIYNNWVRNYIKFVPRYFCNENKYGVNKLLNSFFNNKKVCLLDNEEYIFHSRSQLLSKLKWYGAKVLNYYTSRSDYVICSSNYLEVINKINLLSSNNQSNEFVYINDEKSYVNLRGVNTGKQVKLTEIELLEFLNEDLKIAIEMLHISDKKNEKNLLELKRPRTIWELIGNKDCAEELYKDLWNLRFRSEDLNSLKKLGFIEEFIELNNNINDDLCGIFVSISPSNIGSQISSELTALGCGYDIKVYKGSDIVEPIIKQWKKGHFFKLFNSSELPPICTILTDCSNIIKPNDIIKIRNSYYTHIFFRKEENILNRQNTNSNIKFRKIDNINNKLSIQEKTNNFKSKNEKLNPGVIIFILEETSETAQFILNNSKNSKYFNYNHSYSLNKSENNIMINNPIKILKFSNLSKASLVCKLFNKFDNLKLLNLLINQFGPNLLKLHNILYWIYLLDNKNLNQLNFLSFSYTPIFFNSAFELPLLIIQKSIFNYNYVSTINEIWDFTSFGMLEGQNELFEFLIKIIDDLIYSIILFDEHFINIDKYKISSLNYSIGFDSCNYYYQNSENQTPFYLLFMNDISELDTFYQLEKFPHMEYYTTFQEKKTCESYFSTFYSITLFNLTYILNHYLSNDLSRKNKIIDIIRCKLIKYNSINNNIKELSNFYLNKKQELFLNWKHIEYLYKKQYNSFSNSLMTWKSISIDSNILHLYFRENINSTKYHDIVTYIPSKIPRLNIRIPDVFKQNFLS